MANDKSSTTVLVTGATGFIGTHCVLQLLDQGYRVRGTVRSVERAAQLPDTLAKHGADADRLELVEADLTRDEGWSEAVSGCRYVLHVASPIPRQPPDHEDDLVVPAREGTLRVLRAAAEEGVKRVVLTSSLAAVLYGVERDKTFDEGDWSNPEGPGIGAYEKSKTLAERAAWEFIESLDDGLELTVINPGLVLGPVLDADWGTSGEVVKKLMQRDFPACPDMNWAPVDVRDVAEAHVRAMTEPEAAGKRYICATENASMHDVAVILDRHFRERGYKVPTGRLPSFLVRIVAIFDKTARLGLNDLGKRQDVDNTRIKRELDWKPRSLEEMVVSMGESLIEHEVV